MILIHPPIAKPCEPPAGIAKLSGFLHTHGIQTQVLDANLEGLLSLLNKPQVSADTWTHRALRNFSRHLTSLKGWPIYHHFTRYKRAVMDLERIIQMAVVAEDRGVRLGLANFQHLELSPVRSADLRRSAEKPEENPFYPYFSGRLRQVMEETPSLVVGFSLNYLSQALSTFAMIGFLRREFPGLTLVLGGGLVTSWMRKSGWKNPFQGLVDFLIAGPGEYPLLSILGIQGNGTEGPGLPDYSSLPTADYLAPGPILPFSTADGCYWHHCLFCPEKAEGNPYVPIPADRVPQLLQRLARQTRPILLHILDNAISPELMEKISSNPPGVPWYGFARITRHLADLDFCQALKRSGCVMLQLGLESGDQGVLDQLQKGIDLGVVSLALKTLKRVGIATYVYLLFGTPAETLVEARRTLEFIVHHQDQIHFLNLAIFNLPIDGPDARTLITREFYKGDLSLYTGFSHPKGWNRDTVRQFLDKEFTRHSAISAILRRDPPVFTSNHAPFFVMPAKES